MLACFVPFIDGTKNAYGTKHAKVQKTLTRAGPKNAPDIGNHHLPPRTVRAGFPAYGSSFYFFLL